MLAKPALIVRTTFSTEATCDLSEAERPYFRTAIKMWWLKFRPQHCGSHSVSLSRTQGFSAPAPWYRWWPHASVSMWKVDSGLESLFPSIQFPCYSPRRPSSQKDLMEYGDLSVYMLPWLLPPSQVWDHLLLTWSLWGRNGRGGNQLWAWGGGVSSSVTSEGSSHSH